MNAQTLLATLQKDGPDAPLRALATLSVDRLLEEPVSNAVTAQEAAGWARKFLTGWATSASSTAPVSRVVEALVRELQAERRAVKDVLPKEARAGLKQVLGRPFTFDRKVVLTVIDQAPTRELVRQILLDAVLEFGRRASAPVAGVAKGLGALARMAGETVKSKSGGLGSLVGAVGSEVEKALERRAADFVDAALGGVFGQMADAVADPRRVNEAAELREALFDGVLELTGPQLARELMNADVAGGAEMIRSALTRWLDTPESTKWMESAATLVLGLETGRTSRQLLEELGVLEVARELSIEQATVRLKQVVATDAFSKWLEAVVAAS